MSVEKMPKVTDKASSDAEAFGNKVSSLDLRNTTHPKFIDTNILVYAFDRGNLERGAIAREVVGVLLESGLMRISTQVLQEFFVTVTRKIKTPLSIDKAIEVIEDLELLPIYMIEPRAIREAARLSKSAGLSYWDAMIVVAAAHSGADIVYTEDLKHGQKILGIQIINPFV
jgi:predicted nucleic acid-binding protein